MEKRRRTIYVNDEIWRKVRIKSLEVGISVGDLLTEPFRSISIKRAELRLKDQGVPEDKILKDENPPKDPCPVFEPTKEMIDKAKDRDYSLPNKKKPKFTQKYKDKKSKIKDLQYKLDHPNEKCKVCGKIYRFCHC